MVGLMLSICRPIFGSGKTVVLDSGFCVVKGITNIEDKGVYASSMIKKRRYRTKVFPGDLIDNQFEDKEVGDVEMIETRTEDNKLFKIFSMREPDYVTKRMASWVTLEELMSARIRKYFIDISGTKDTKQFT